MRVNCRFRVQGLARKVWRVEPLVSGRVLGVYVEVLCCECLVPRISRVSRVSRVLHRLAPHLSLGLVIVSLPPSPELALLYASSPLCPKP